MKAFLIIAACTLLSIFANAKDAQPAEKLCDENIGGSYVIKYSSFMRFSHFATTTVEKGVADLEKRTCTYKVTNQLIQDELDWLMSDSLPEGKHQPKSKGFSGVLQGVQYIQMTNVKTGLDSQGQQPYATGELKILDEAKKAASGFDGFTVTTRPRYWGINANKGNDIISINFPETIGPCGTLEGGGSPCPPPARIEFIYNGTLQ